MTTNFPAGLDALSNPTDSDELDSPNHASQHADANDAVEALEAKVGVNGSAVTTSLDYQMENHAHTGGADDGGVIPTANLSGHTKAAHDALALSHDSLGDVSANDHHAQAHSGGDHTDPAAAVTQAFGDAALAGTASNPPASDDHRHGMPANPVTTHEAAADPHTGYLRESWLQVVRKTANETVTSSTTLQDDDHLTFSIAANEVWTVLAVLYVTGAEAGDIKIAWNVPAGAAGHHGIIGIGVDNTAGVESAATSAFGAGSDLTVAQNSGIDSSSRNTLLATVCVVNGATAGAVTLQWAQRASSASSTFIVANSYLLAHRAA